MAEDEVSFDYRLRELRPDALWRCSQPGVAGLHQVHLHATLLDALRCGGIQAFLHLPFGASLPPGVVVATGVSVPNGPDIEAVVQLLESRLIDNEDEHLYRSGRLSTKWYETEVGAAMHQVLVDQAGLVWKSLRETTTHARGTESGGRASSLGRIGDHARSRVIDSEIPLARNGFHRYRLIDAHAGVPAH